MLHRLVEMKTTIIAVVDALVSQDPSSPETLILPASQSVSCCCLAAEPPGSCLWWKEGAFPKVSPFRQGSLGPMSGNAVAPCLSPGHGSRAVLWTGYRLWCDCITAHLVPLPLLPSAFPGVPTPIPHPVNFPPSLSEPVPKTLP